MAAVIGGAALVGAARAQEPPRPAEPTSPALYADWSGPYLGAGAGAGGSFGKFELAPFTIAGSPAPGFTSGFGRTRSDTPIFAGGFAGYNWQSGSLVYGVEGEIAAATLKRAIGADEGPGFAGGLGRVSPRGSVVEGGGTGSGLAGGGGTEAANGEDTVSDLFRLKRDRSALLRARLGFAFDDYLLYATAGIATANLRAVSNLPGQPVRAGGSDQVVGPTFGIGIQALISPQLALGVDYRRSVFDADLGRVGDPALGRVRFTTDDVMARLTWFPQGLRPAPEAPEPAPGERADWSIHGQTTYIQQATPRFRSPYTGDFSFLPDQGRETWSLTAYVGRRLWEGAEIYYNPELNQGFGLSNTLGIAGYINGEAQKAGAPYPKFRNQRYFLRQVIGLGGETESVPDGLNQIAGTRDIDRITITIGKFAVGDFFDDNAYAHDPRLTFNNWSLWASTAVDFPANLPGFTEGVVVDLNRKEWALRAGYFLVPVAPNNNTLDDRHLDRAGGGIVEFEQRFQLFDQPGKLRLGAFVNRGRTASYREALILSAVDSSLEPTDAAVASRRFRFKRGAYANLEQAVTAEIGVFARASFNDGRNEILSFTDVDRMVSGGVSVKGAAWGRPRDVVGIGGVVNALSQPHRDYLAAGGLGLLVGDGRLNYRPEQALESYYSLSLGDALALTFDYQWVNNPGYNADRGPAHIFGTRLHAEF